ncbi:MAG: flavin reductase family protein [Deferrisomatales bacterium]|nr:flavin reductase family protein [Deferrisomatales bacterium]
MDKVKLGPKTCLYPMPTVLVGALVGGKANYLTVAYCGIVQHKPPMVAVTLGRGHYTNVGIREHGTFSVNIPPARLAEVTDWVGLHSGAAVDKSGVFENVYGVLGTAPMIRECPLNLECRVVRTLDLGGMNEVFIGEIAEVYADPGILTEGLPDLAKLDPIVFSMHDNTYWRVGEKLGTAWSLGRAFRGGRRGAGAAPGG